MKSRIRFSKENGDWGIEGVDLTKLSPKLYGAAMKLKRYEDIGMDPHEVEEAQEWLHDFDKMYLEKCEEVNRLTKELAAYDPEKVIQQIGDISEPVRPVGWSRKIEVVETKAAIEIVRNGGVE